MCSHQTMTRCGASNLSLSALSISSNDSLATQQTMASGMTHSTLKRGFGSHACSNLSSLAAHAEGSQSIRSSSMGMQVDTTGDDWGYFVDATPQSKSLGGVQISW
jgi:hypothetical protein